ncbi:hypothetical protein [Streptomyces sannanensis]
MRKQAAAAASALVLTLALAAACGDHGGHPRTATGTLEQLAAKAGCEPDIQTDATELRQADCATDGGRYVLMTFATDRGRREWLNGAKDYGGAYLVGGTWVAVGDRTVVTALRGRLGGTVETGTSHHRERHGS